MNLYAAYWIEEPDVRASFTERDSLIWFDNDVEVFLRAGTVTTNLKSTPLTPYTMSTKELARLTVIKGAIEGVYTVKQATRKLRISTRG
ncbi:MAG: hypothetical protein LBD47_08640 [Treponema sp.]|nr:hypothetical protein [Treponema sp.]